MSLVNCEAGSQNRHLTVVKRRNCRGTAGIGPLFARNGIGVGFDRYASLGIGTRGPANATSACEEILPLLAPGICVQRVAWGNAGKYSKKWHAVSISQA